MFLEVIPEDLVTIHSDPSQTVGLFDGQQPLPVVERAAQEADVKPAQEWHSWPSGLQENQIKIKPEVQGKYGREMAAAIQAVQLACMLSQRVQERLLRHKEKSGEKKDKSLITVAGTSILPSSTLIPVRCRRRVHYGFTQNASPEFHPEHFTSHTNFLKNP